MHACVLLVLTSPAAGGWFSIMMALIFGGIMLLWFWGSTHKHAFFAKRFNPHIKTLEDLLVATADSEDETAPHKLCLVNDDKQVSALRHCIFAGSCNACRCCLFR